LSCRSRRSCRSGRASRTTWATWSAGRAHPRAAEELPHGVPNLGGFDAVRQLDRLDNAPKLRQGPGLDREVGQELVEHFRRRLGAGVGGQQGHQLVALTGLAPSPLSVLLETGIGAHLWRAAGTTRARTPVAERRTRATRTAWPIAERRARTARTSRPVAKWRTRAAGPIAERWARAAGAAGPIAEWRPTNTRQRSGQTALESRSLATAVRTSEPLATAWRATAAALAALAATATSTGSATLATTATTRPDRHVATTAVIVVHAATV
jgi:hypothetical protein